MPEGALYPPAAFPELRASRRPVVDRFVRQKCIPELEGTHRPKSLGFGRNSFKLRVLRKEGRGQRVKKFVGRSNNLLSDKGGGREGGGKAGKREQGRDPEKERTESHRGSS